MRFLVASLFVAFTAPTFAADKDEDKAKEVSGAFWKAIAAKDIDAVMKTVDVPFQKSHVHPDTIDKPEELKAFFAALLRLVEPKDFMDLKVGKVYDMAGIIKYAKENKDEKLAEQAEKLVGKNGYMVTVIEKGKETPGVLIRVKDGKAFVAGVLK